MDIFFFELLVCFFLIILVLYEWIIEKLKFNKLLKFE